MAWDTVSDVNDGQSLSGTWIDEVRDAIAQLQAAIGSDVPATAIDSDSAWSTPFNAGVDTTGGTFTRARYSQVGKQVTCELDFVFGASSALTGDVILALPVTAGGIRGIGGDALLIDATGGTHEGAVVPSSATLVAIRRWRQSGTDDVTTQTLTSAIPFTWTTNDRIIVHLHYLAA